MTLIIGICTGIMLLTIWFETDFRVYLFNSFGKNFTSEYIEQNIVIHFNQRIFGTEFTTSGLILCDYCLGFWIAAAISIFAGPMYLPVIYVGQIVGYKILNPLD